MPSTATALGGKYFFDDHQLDFLDAIRTGRKPNADVAEGHDSVALVHLANIAVRAGRSLDIDPENEWINGDDESAKMISRTYPYADDEPARPYFAQVRTPCGIPAISK